MLEEKGTKQKILLTAMKLFGEYGYEKTSMRMIAEESEISKPAIYYYFPDKDSLFNGLIKYGINHVQDEIKDIIYSPKSLREKLIDIIMSHFRNIPDHPSVSKFISQMIRGGIKFNMGPEYKDLFLKQSNTLFNLIQDAIDKGELRKDVDKKSFIYCLIGAMNHYTRNYFVLGQPALTEKGAGKIVDILLNGALNREN